MTGGAVALALACRYLIGEGLVERTPMREMVAAVSVGMVSGAARLDLDYREDFAADVDMNVVCTEAGALVEVQGTAEGDPFTRDEHDELLDLALAGVRELIAGQHRALESAS